MNHRSLTAIFVDMPSTDSLTVRATLFSFGFLNLYRSTVMDTSPEGDRVLLFMRLCRYWPNQRPTMALVPFRLPFLDQTICCFDAERLLCPVRAASSLLGRSLDTKYNVEVTRPFRHPAS